MAGSKTAKAKPKPKESKRGKPGPHGSTAEMAERNAELVAAKARGLSWAQIEATYQVSERRGREILAEWRSRNPALRTHDPIQIIDELIEGYQADIEELVIIAATTASDSARVGAVNARMSARQKIAELLQAVGVLPHDLGSMRVEIDARVTAQRMITVLNQFNVSDEVRDALVAALEDSPDVLELEPGDVVEMT